MGNKQARVEYSADGESWWDGAEWQPAYTADRKYRFDGTTWVAQGIWWRPRLTRAERWVGWSFVALFAVWIVWAFWSARGAHVLPDGQLAISMTHSADVAQTVLGVVSLAFSSIATGCLVWRRRSSLVVWLVGATTVGMGVVFALSNFLILLGDTSHGHHGGVASTLLVAVLFAALAVMFSLEPLLICFGLGAVVGVVGRRLTRRTDPVPELVP